MATASSAGPVVDRDRVLHAFVLPVVVAAVAVILSAFIGHLTMGLLAAGGVALGAINGLLMERATTKLTPEAGQTRQVIVKASLGRLGIITLVALALAVLFQPDGWVLLVALACYQLLTLLATLSAAAREARQG